ncbi:MAG: helix-turn-helix transcriptional regulator [Thermodesulfobacteriota bacterium]
MADEPQFPPIPNAAPKIDGNIIRRLREEKGLTQLYVATVVGVTTDTISRWENRRYSSIKPENAKKLAEALEVPLAEILDQTGPAPEEPQPSPAPPRDLPPPPPPPRSRQVGIGLALLLLLTIGAIFLAWWFASRQPLPVVATRVLPPHAPIGLPFPVAITVTPAVGEATPLIISETMAPQCSALEAAPPFTAANAATRTFKWIAKPQGRTTLFYLAVITPHAPGLSRIPFHGEITLHGGSGGAMLPIGGAAGIAVAPYHWADRNRDFRIDDEEILAVYDTFGTAGGLHLETSLIEDIWSGHGYRWDASRSQLVVVP